jgi:hypothetical protein
MVVATAVLFCWLRHLANCGERERFLNRLSRISLRSSALIRRNADNAELASLGEPSSAKRPRATFVWSLVSDSRLSISISRCVSSASRFFVPGSIRCLSPCYNSGGTDAHPTGALNYLQKDVSESGKQLAHSPAHHLSRAPPPRRKRIISRVPVFQIHILPLPSAESTFGAGSNLINVWFRVPPCRDAGGRRRRLPGLIRVE